jgi:hypothetical protein
MRNPSGVRNTFTGVLSALPDFRPTCVSMPKPGNRAANRLVIRFVTARLKAAIQRLRNRIRRIGASRIIRSKMTDAAIGIGGCILTYSKQGGNICSELCDLK